MYKPVKNRIKRMQPFLILFRLFCFLLASASFAQLLGMGRPVGKKFAQFNAPQAKALSHPFFQHERYCKEIISGLEHQQMNSISILSIFESHLVPFIAYRKAQIESGHPVPARCLDRWNNIIADYAFTNIVVLHYYYREIVNLFQTLAIECATSHLYPLCAKQKIKKYYGNVDHYHNALLAEELACHTAMLKVVANRSSFSHYNQIQILNPTKENEYHKAKRRKVAQGKYHE